MQDPDRPNDDLAELHRMFLELRAIASLPARQQFASKIVDHPASQPRLKSKCTAMRKRFAGRRDLQDDVLDEALLTLVRWFSRKSLRYQDRGAACFGAWYSAVCERACRRAWKKYLSQDLDSIDALDRLGILRSRGATLLELCWADVLLGISKIPDPVTRIVMLNRAEGIPAEQTAENCRISVWDVSRHRKKGLAFLQRYFQLGSE
ncbi:MAG TPA: hypothetical protein VKU82_16430 [Planctomycetaceae bacterium]|nr:hypothetical protein [Planctomycetaceae bacterium]